MIGKLSFYKVFKSFLAYSTKEEDLKMIKDINWLLFTVNESDSKLRSTKETENFLKKNLRVNAMVL